MLYDTIGVDYATTRVPDARIAAYLHAAIGDADSIVNVGAGTGSYKPPDRWVAAIEPSMTMIRQRPAGSAPAIQAVASSLPLRDDCTSTAMAVLTVHHWADRSRALRELARIARDRIAFLTWNPVQGPAAISESGRTRQGVGPRHGPGRADPSRLHRRCKPALKLDQDCGLTGVED